MQRWDSSHFYNLYVRKHGPEHFFARQNYYLMATQFLNAFGFTNERDQLVWRLHADGFSNREITKQLSDLNIKRDAVTKIVKRLAKLMRTGMFFGD